MTVIAWDGKTLAADKQSTCEEYARIVTKIHRITNGLVGFTGDAIPAAALLQWFRNGMLPDQWPKKIGDKEAFATFIDLSGKVHIYSSAEAPYAEQLEDNFYAAGHGRDFALAAMYLGKSARDAVAVACALDNTCGKGIDTLELQQVRSSAAPIASDDLQWTEDEKDHLRELEPKPLVFNMINPLLVPR